MKRWTTLAATTGVLSLALVGCGQPAPETNASGSASDFTACMVSDAGGIDDRSFNASAWKGLEDAKTDYGMQAKFVESKADTDYAPNIDNLVQDDCGVIITVGFLMGDATAEAAKANPDEKFAIVDSAPATPVDNVKPLMFDTAQASYLAGYLAAGMTKTGTVATFGGIAIPPVTVFMDGFADGVAEYNKEKGKNVKLLGWDKAKQNGSFTGDFDDQNKGKQVTQNFIQEGADIIFPVAGPVGLGAAAAAKDTNGKVNLIWVDSDGYETAGDYKSLFITSVLKRVDHATETVAKEALDGKYSSDQYVGTLANEGVGLAPYHDFDAKVPQELKDDIAKLTERVKSGELKVESQSSPK